MVSIIFPLMCPLQVARIKRQKSAYRAHSAGLNRHILSGTKTLITFFSNECPLFPPPPCSAYLIPYQPQMRQAQWENFISFVVPCLTDI